jgi:hypothetical protein
MTSTPALPAPRIASPADLRSATHHHFRGARLEWVLNAVTVAGVVAGLAGVSRALSGVHPHIALTVAGVCAAVAAASAAAGALARRALARRTGDDFRALRSGGWIAEQVALDLGDGRPPVAIVTHPLLDREGAREEARRIRRRLDGLTPAARRVTAHRLRRLAETGRPVAGEVPELPRRTLLAPASPGGAPVLVLPGTGEGGRARILPCRAR